MALRILITAATKTEIAPISDINIPEIIVEPLVSGIGSVATVWSLMNYLANNPKPDIVLNIGIAGSYSKQFPVNSVVIPARDRFGDLGIEGAIGFTTLFESGLANPDRVPYREGMLYADSNLISICKGSYPLVEGVTVNSTSGNELTIARMINRFSPEIETMEVAAFYYLCTMEMLPGISIRSISNMVEPRQREKWDIPAAVDILGREVKSVLKLIAER
jgi:futalosine hydrolase